MQPAQHILRNMLLKGEQKNLDAAWARLDKDPKFKGRQEIHLAVPQQGAARMKITTKTEQLG